MFYQILALVIDIGLGALAWRLAKTVAADVADLKSRVIKLEEKCLGV